MREREMISGAIEKELEGKSPWRLLLEYSGPAIVESIAVSLYNIVDSVFIGHEVGPMALAALAVALPLMNLVIGFCTLVGVGGAAMISILLGKKQKTQAQITVNSVVALCLVHSIIFGGLMLLYLDPILKIFGATSATIVYAHRYMRIILAFTPISYMFIGLNNLMRASGYPRKAMISALLSVVVNIALCALLVTRMHLNVEGAAFATVAGQTVALVWCILHFVSPKSLVRFNFRLPWFRWGIVKKMYAIGLSPFLMNLAACVVVVFLNKALLTEGGIEGNYDVGAYGILNRVTMVFIMIVGGISMGMQPILGYNYGAGHWDRVKQTLRLGIFAGVAVTTIGWALTELCPDLLSAMFTSNEEMMTIARRGFRIYFICYPVVGAEIVIQNFFQYIDKSKWSILLSMTRQLVFLLPLLLFMSRRWGVPGVWGSMAASDMLAFIVALVVLLLTMRGFNRQYSNQRSS